MMLRTSPAHSSEFVSSLMDKTLPLIVRRYAQVAERNTGTGTIKIKQARNEQLAQLASHTRACTVDMFITHKVIPIPPGVLTPVWMKHVHIEYTLPTVMYAERK
jgi:hypothetical protein